MNEDNNTTPIISCMPVPGSAQNRLCWRRENSLGGAFSGAPPVFDILDIKSDNLSNS